MNHRSQHELYHDQAFDNNNTIIKEPYEPKHQFKSNSAIDQGQTNIHQKEVQYLLNEQQTPFSLSKNLSTYESNPISNSEIFDEKYETDVKSTVNIGHTNDNNSLSSPVLSGLKNTAYLAVDVIREKLISFRLSGHSNSSQTSNDTDNDNFDSDPFSASFNNNPTLQEPIDSLKNEQMQNFDNRDCGNNFEGICKATPINISEDNTRNFETGSKYQSKTQSSFNNSSKTPNDSANGQSTLTKSLSNEVFENDSDKSNLINLEKQYKMGCDFSPYGRINVDTSMSKSSSNSLKDHVENIKTSTTENMPANKELGDSMKPTDEQLKNSSPPIAKEKNDDYEVQKENKATPPSSTPTLSDQNDNLSESFSTINRQFKISSSDEHSVKGAEESSYDNNDPDCPFCQRLPEDLEKANDKDGTLKLDSSDGLEHMQTGIKLWQVRNNLEETTIAIQCHISNQHGQGNGECQKHPLSITTDGMTEASPLSTPSSSRAISMEKSISDSDFDNDFEGKQYYVTECGRLSPLPQCHCKVENLTTSPEKTARHKSPGIHSMCSCKDHDISTTFARDFSQNVEESFETTTENAISLREDFEKPREEEKNLDQDNPGQNGADVQRVNSLDSNGSDFNPVMPIRSSSANDCSTNSTATSRTDKKPSIFSLLNEKQPEEMPRRVSLPVLGIEPSSQSFGNRFLNPFIRRFSSLERKRREKESKSLKTQTPQRSMIERNRNAASNLRVRSSYRKKDSVSSDEVFEAARSPTTTGSNLSLGQDFEDTSRRSDGDINTKIRSPDQKQNYLEPAPRTRRATSLIPMATGRDSDIQKVNRRYKKNYRSQRQDPTDKLGAKSKFNFLSKKRTLSQSKSIDESDDNTSTTSFPTTRSGPRPSAVSRLIRRSQFTLKRNRSVPTFCGYSMERDFCVDAETDRIFKDFLFNDTPTIATPLTEEDPSVTREAPPQSPLKNTPATRLHREVLQKQYSDPIAPYSNQKQRRMRFAKQRSDSLNFSIDQDPIEEELDVDSSTPVQRTSKQPLKTVENRSKQWGQNERKSQCKNLDSESITSSRNSDDSDSIDSQREKSAKNNF